MSAPFPAAANEMWAGYEALIREAAKLDRARLIERLDCTLPGLWKADYRGMPGSTANLLIVTFGDESRGSQFCRYLFDHASDQVHKEDNAVEAAHQTAEDRVVAVWGTSRREGARTRDSGRIRGFLRGAWVDTGDDRGHFFAHTMGGGLDINLFPQAARVNRAGPWREMERYCARNSGTFCFVRPIYADKSWRPARLEYGIVKIEAGKPPEFWGNLFGN